MLPWNDLATANTTIADLTRDLADARKALAERTEACARVCEDWGRGWFGRVVDRSMAAQECAAAVRALVQP